MNGSHPRAVTVITNVIRDGIVSMTNKSFTGTVESDENGELVLVFPQGLLEQVGWAIGDTIVWKNNPDGTWALIKKEHDE